MAIDVAVLLSVGCHPASGRPRRAERDARALEMALNLPDVRIHAIHAGDVDTGALRDYLGMGLASLTVLPTEAGQDPLTALADHLRKLKPALVLAGSVAEHGLSSGQLPYALAQALDYPLANAICELALESGRATLLQALPRGRRRSLAVALPAVLTIDMAAAAPRQVSYAAGLRGKLEEVMAGGPMPTEPQFERIAARKRPKRLRTLAGGGSAADRLKQASQAKAGRGQLMVQPEPEVAAQAIYDYLLEEGILIAPVGKA